MDIVSVLYRHGYLPTVSGQNCKGSVAPAHGAESAKCWVVQILPASTRLDSEERWLSYRKPRGFGRLGLPSVIARKARKSADIAHDRPWRGGGRMVGDPNFATFCASRSGGAWRLLSESPRIWPPALTGRYRPKSTKIGGYRPWIAGGKMLRGPNFAAFCASSPAELIGGRGSR